MAKTRKAHIIFRALRSLAFLWLLFAGYTGYQTYIFLESSSRTEGIVLEVETIYSDDGVSYRPTIGFKDYLGKAMRATPPETSSSYNFQQGERVDILYFLGDSRDIRINTFWSIWGRTVSTTFSALIILFVTSALAARSAAGRNKVRTGQEATLAPVPKGTHLVDHRAEAARIEKQAPPPTVRRMR